MSEEKETTVIATSIVDDDDLVVPSSSDSNSNGDWEKNIDRFMEEFMMCGMWMGEQGAQCDGQLLETENRVEEFLIVRTNTIEDKDESHSKWNDSLVTQYRSRQIVYNYETEEQEMI